MKNIAVIPNKYKDFNLSGTKNVIDIIKASGGNPMLSEEYSDSGIDVGYVSKAEIGKADMLVVLGGDGTILSTVREYGEFDIPILGINHGHLGFLAEIEKTEDEDLISILKGDYTIAKHMTLDVSAGDKKFNALNDAVIHRGGFSRMLEFSLYIENKRVNSILADGLIISTPTGSTAYSLSAGGPIADPALEILIVTPICSHDLTSRSIILPAYRNVRITVKVAEKTDAVLTIDGQTGYNLKNDDNIYVSGGKKIGLIRTINSSFYEKLRRKMYENRNGGR